MTVDDRVNRPLSQTVVETLIKSLYSASAHNPNDASQPVAVLWTDRDSQWQPVIPSLRRLMPQLLALGTYEPEQRTGPSIWLRCVIDRVLASPEIPTESTPIIYLPGVSRKDLGAAEDCPDHLKPLVELQYRGASWTQKNGKDWTVKAFLVSGNGGLGLDVARDAATHQSMLRAVGELVTASVEMLQGRHLEAEDFDRLFSDDPVRDVLAWLNDSEGVRSGWDADRWNAFVSRCEADFQFDPTKDGEIVGAERLGLREGAWASVWNRFAESPALYPGIPELLRRAMPHDLFAEPRSSWPQNNDQDESELRQSFSSLENKVQSAARELVIDLEKMHGQRRDWVWAKLGQAPLAHALAHLAKLAEGTSNNLGGASAAEMANLYANGAWKVDAAALAGMAAVKSEVDAQAVSRALNAIYSPWLESAARHLQALVEMEPLPSHGGQDANDVRVDSGGVILFADGLRFDVSQSLVERLRSQGRSVAATRRWAGLPSVTATAKPAVSPVADRIKGIALGEDFLPATVDDGRRLTTARFRKLLGNAEYQFLGAGETGDPSGRAWTENGELDHLGHALQGKLAARIDDQIGLMAERIEALLDSGWREVRVVTDHGWLWLPGGLPKSSIPVYLTNSRWARCAAIKGGSTVESPTVPWYWNSNERVAVGPGISCFGAGNKYAHGGISLQECLIPVLRITARTRTAKARVIIVAVSWVGLRCRVRIEAAQPGLSIDLRTRVNDADSSVSRVRNVDAVGAASLLVPDDELEGAPAAVVVLDKGGQVIARQSTIIGGED